MGDESKVVTLSRGETDGRRTDEVEAQTRVAGVEDKLRQAKLDNVERQEASLSLAEENERYRIVIQDLTTRLQASERRVVNLEERLSHQWQQLTQLESKCEELSVDLGIGGSGPGMHDVLEAFGVRYQELKHQYDQAEVSLSALHAQLFRFDVRIRSLIEELAQAQERSIRFQKERDKLRDERDSLRAALHASKQVCDRKLASVRKRLAKAEADLNVTEDRIRRLLSSKTWRYTESIRALYGACRRAFMKTRWLWDESSSSQRRA